MGAQDLQTIGIANKKWNDF